MNETQVEIGKRLPANPAYEIPDIAHEVRNGPYLPRRMFLVTRYDCPFKCDHCFFYSNPKATEVMDERTIHAAMFTAIDLDIEDVVITGGEAMIDPDMVCDIAEYCRDLGITPLVQTSYMGDDPYAIRQNAAKLKASGADDVISSISTYHRDSFPKSSHYQDYLDYAVVFIDILTQEGLELQYKLPWDLEGVHDAEDLMHEVVRTLSDRTEVQVVTHLYRRMGLLNHDSAEVLQVNGKNVILVNAPIIMVGNARPKGLKTEEWASSMMYECPVRSQKDHEEGMLTVYPDGTTARCCSGEKGIDFGFGNVLTHSSDDIRRNIERSRFLSNNISAILKLAHQVMYSEFPHLLPKGGPKQACETCSPLMSHGAVKKRVAELLGVPGLFDTPIPRESGIY